MSEDEIEDSTEELEVDEDDMDDEDDLDTITDSDIGQ